MMHNHGRTIQRAVLLVLILAFAACPADPPGDGFLIINARITSPASAEVGDVSMLRFSVKRIDVVHQAIAGTSDQVITIDSTARIFELSLTSTSVQRIALLPVPPGAVKQVRVVVSEVVGLHGDNLVPILLPSGEQTGLKLVPEGVSSFPIEKDRNTVIEAQVDASRQLFTNRGTGLHLKPTTKTLLTSDGAEVSPVVPGRLIVKFRAGLTRPEIEGMISALAATVFQEGRDNYFLVSLPNTITIEDAATRLSADARVVFALPDLFDTPRRIPRDPLFLPLQTNSYTAVGAVGAWDVTTGSPEVVVAVVDNGFDIDHPDLIDNVWINVGELPAELRSGFTADCNRDLVTTFRDLNCEECVLDPDEPGTPPEDLCRRRIDAARSAACARDSRVCVPSGRITPSVLIASLRDGESDATGYPDDIIGWDFLGNDNDPSFTTAEVAEAGAPDALHHGTEIAGTIAAVSDNDLAVAGTAWRGRLALIRAASTGTNRNAFVYASQQVHAHVVNYSRGLLAMAGDPPPSDTCSEPKILTRTQEQIDSKSRAYLDDLRSLAMGGTLFVVAVANCGVDIDRPDVLDTYAELGLPNFISVTTGSGSQAFGASKVDIAGLSQPGAALANRAVLAVGTRINTPGQFGPSASFAAAQVSGTALLVLSVREDLRGNPACLKSLLLRSVDATPIRPTVAGGVLQMRTAVLDTGNCP